MDRHVRNRLVIGHAAIALVLILGAATTFVALEAAVRRDDRTAAVEQRLALIRDLRADTRALAISARRYLLSGDWKDRDHVFAVNDQVSKRRNALRARSAYPAGWTADLGEYTATLTTAMSRNTDDIATVAHFEDELQRVRNALDITLDSIVARERSELASQKSMTLARRAQWASVVASVLGLALLLATGVSVFRLVRPSARRRQPSLPHRALYE